MTLKQMRYFLAVVQMGSFSAAARAFYVAQPALSRQISQLEAELGMQLIDRSHAGIQLTEPGRRFHEVALSLVRQVEGVRDHLASSGDHPVGRVAVAIPVSTASLLLPRLVSACEQRFPGINLAVLDGLSLNSRHVVESGQVDLGVVPNAEELHKVCAEPILAEDLYLVGRKERGRAAGDCVTMNQAARHRLVMGPPKMHLRRRAEQAALEAGVRLNVCYEQRSAAAIESMVQSGLAFTIINWPPVAAMCAEGSVVARRIVRPKLRRTISIVSVANRPLSPAAVAVRSLVRELLVELVAAGHWRGELLVTA